MSSEIELLTADVLLERGVRVSVRAPLFFRCLGIKFLRLTAYRPSLGNRIRIARLQLTLGVPLDELKNPSQELKEQLLATRADTVYRIVAFAFLKGKILPQLLVRPIAWLLRKGLDDKEVFNLYRLLVFYGSTDPFFNIITSESMLLSPMMSQEPGRS